jgi:hypothetical protein
VIEIFVGAAPGSNIASAQITARGNGFSASLTVSAGQQARTAVVPIAPSGLTDIELSLRSADRKVSVYAGNIPDDATITILGSNALRFDGQIHHRHATTSPTVQTCTLKCTPTSTPMNGPGCRECDENGLVFKVCC